MHICGKDRVVGRVGSDFLSAIAGRVGSMFRRVGSGPRKVTRGQLCVVLSKTLNSCGAIEEKIL